MKLQKLISRVVYGYTFGPWTTRVKCPGFDDNAYCFFGDSTNILDYCRSWRSLGDFWIDYQPDYGNSICVWFPSPVDFYVMSKEIYPNATRFILVVLVMMIFMLIYKCWFSRSNKIKEANLDRRDKFKIN